MGIGHEHLVDEVFFLLGRGELATPAAPLGLILVDRLTFGITLMGQRDHDLLRRDQILHAEVEMIGEDLGAPRIGVVAADLHQLIADDRHQAHGIGQDQPQFADAVEQTAVFLEQLVLFQRRQPV